MLCANYGVLAPIESYQRALRRQVTSSHIGRTDRVPGRPRDHWITENTHL